MAGVLTDPPPDLGALPPARSLSGDGPLLTGTAATLAVRLDVEPVAMRLCFVVLAAAGGSGVAIYLVVWLLMVRGAQPPRFPAVSRRTDPTRTLGLVLVLLGSLLGLRSLGFGFVDELMWPVTAVAVGLMFVWHQVGDDTGWRWLLDRGDDTQRVAVGPWQVRADVLRLAGGFVLVAGGNTYLLATNLRAEFLRDSLIAAAITAAGVLLLVGPWIFRLSRGLIDERNRRVRADERAEVAAHLHDSVLQTLTLIQKRADDPTAMAALARRQERELRRWLYGRGEAVDPNQGETLRDAFERVAAEVEDTHRVPVEVVIVGDAPVDESVRAVLGAAREALVNAARSSGAPQVSLFVEAGTDGLEVFVRDKGVGFDPATVPSDRHGISESIVGRMERTGGTAEVLSTVGEGTEVRLRLPGGRR